MKKFETLSFLPLVKKVLWSVLLEGARPRQKSSAVDPHHDGQLGLLVGFRNVDVEEEAILLADHVPRIVPGGLLRTHDRGL